MKLKIKPTSKIKRRYILLNAKSKDDIEEAIIDYIGILGWAKAAPVFVKNKNKDLILSINRKSIDNVRAAFELSPLGIKAKRVSGTLKRLYK